MTFKDAIESAEQVSYSDIDKLINDILSDFAKYLESGDAVVAIEEFTSDERQMLIANFRRWSNLLEEEKYE